MSGAAIGTDGQLTVYCHGEDGARLLLDCGVLAWRSALAPLVLLRARGHTIRSRHPICAGHLPTEASRTFAAILAGPCYRCLFPESPAAGNCARCVDAGVLGVVPGVIGTLQVRAQNWLGAGHFGGVRAGPLSSCCLRRGVSDWCL